MLHTAIQQVQLCAPSLYLFDHIRAVSTITDSISVPCNNHSQIVAAKRVPPSRGGQSLPKAAFYPLFENQKQKWPLRPFPKGEPVVAFRS
jgi:hypothetical protein